MNNTKNYLHIRVLNKVIEAARDAYDADEGVKCASLLKIGSEMGSIANASTSIDTNKAFQVIKNSELSALEKYMLMTELESETWDNA